MRRRAKLFGDLAYNLQPEGLKAPVARYGRDRPQHPFHVVALAGVGHPTGKLNRNLSRSLYAFPGSGQRLVKAEILVSATLSFDLTDVDAHHVTSTIIQTCIFACQGIFPFAPAQLSLPSPEGQPQGFYLVSGGFQHRGLVRGVNLVALVGAAAEEVDAKVPRKAVIGNGAVTVGHAVHRSGDSPPVHFDDDRPP